jgi:hypothetical protein
VSLSAIATSPAYTDPFVQQQQAAQPASQNHSASRPGSGGSGAEHPSEAAHLSASAEVQQLAREGANSVAIAVSTGLTVSEVDGDLGISTGRTIAANASLGGQNIAHEQVNPAAPVSPLSPAHHPFLTATPSHSLSIKA